jgi:hypothetical protein
VHRSFRVSFVFRCTSLFKPLYTPLLTLRPSPLRAYNDITHSCHRPESILKTMSSHQTNVASHTHGSLTLTASQAGPVTLRLRAEAETSERRRIQWAEDVVDNEGMGKKSSKGLLFP